MKHDSRKTFTGRFTDGIRKKFNEMSELNPDYTDSQIVEEIVKQCAANVQTDNSAVIDNLQSELDNLTAERDNLVASNGELTAKIEKLTAECEQWKQTANENGVGASAKDAEVENLQEENKVLKSNLAAYEQTKENVTGGIVLQEATKKILERVAVKLSERYGKAIDVNQIVNMCILRYNIERYTAWFHPFVIDDAEIEKLTGKSRRDWMKFFNTNE